MNDELNEIELKEKEAKTIEDEKEEEVINPYRKVSENEDPLLIRVVDSLVGNGIINKGLIVKGFNPGYNRAEKIMEQLEARKIVSEKLNYKGDRKFLISETEWLSNKGSMEE